MNEMYEREIDICWLCYRVLRCWRSILLFSIISALVVGVTCFSYRMLQVSNPEYIEKASQSYQREYNSWAATGKNIRAEINNLTMDRNRQREYNEKSVLMQINPLRESNTYFELYVDYDYQILPDMTYQNIDLSNRIIKSYETYLKKGELFKDVIENLNYDIEIQYLEEIVEVEVDYDTNMINVLVKHVDLEKSKEILDLVQFCLDKKHTQINKKIGIHKLTVTNSGEYESVNFELDEIQQNNIRNVSDLEIKIHEKNLELREWSSLETPKKEYSILEIVKSNIKQSIFTGVIVAGLLVIGISCIHLFSNKLLNSHDIQNCFGVRVIGTLPYTSKKKSFGNDLRCASVFGGTVICPEKYESIAKMISASIKAEIQSSEESRGWKELVFTGILPQEQLKNVVDNLKLDDDYNISIAPDILNNSDAIEKIMAADAVVLLEEQEKSIIANIEKELNLLRVWKKPVIGSIVINVDAII